MSLFKRAFVLVDFFARARCRIPVNCNRSPLFHFAISTRPISKGIFCEEGRLNYSNSSLSVVYARLDCVYENDVLRRIFFSLAVKINYEFILTRDNSEILFKIKLSSFLKSIWNVYRKI